MKKLELAIILIIVAIIATTASLFIPEVPNTGTMTFGPTEQEWKFEGNFAYFIAWEADGEGTFTVYTAERCPTKDGHATSAPQELATGVSLEEIFAVYLFTSAELTDGDETWIEYTHGDSQVTRLIRICE